MSLAVSLSNISKTFDNRTVVKALNFTVNRGEIFSLLGPNGAGKTTTIRMITTLTQPSQGNIQVAGFDVNLEALAVKQRIGVVLQQISVDGDLTVWENMEYHGRLHHIPKPQRQERIDRWLRYVDLIERRTDLVKTLSGGMKRRLQIARALLHEPEILFLDEPTVGLDPQNRRRLWEILRDLNQQGMTMLLTTHYMEEVEYLCKACEPPTGGGSRIGIMDQGELIELGTLTELRQKHGEGLVVTQSGDRWDYRFFPNLEAANQHLEQLPQKTGVMVRPSNLEDIFVELTGRQLD